jgi:hypothetical protein
MFLILMGLKKIQFVPPDPFFKGKNKFYWTPPVPATPRRGLKEGEEHD